MQQLKDKHFHLVFFCQAQGPTLGPTLGPTQGRVKVKVQLKSGT